MWSIIKARLLILALSLHIALSICAPLLLPEPLQQERNRITAPTQVAPLEDRAASASSQKAVQSAASAFANDVSTVSSSLNGLGATTDKTKIKQLATAGFNAEKDEDSHRAVLFKAAGSTAKTANQKIVANTPTVLKGLQSIMQNPTAANTMKQLSTVESAR